MSRGRILVVEDDRVSRESLARLLRALDFRVETADTVAAAMIHFADPPHCLLLDVDLPDGSGVEIAQLARRVRPDCRIAYITGAVMPGELPHAADGFFLKPVHADAVLTWAQRACGPAHAAAAPAAPAPAAPATGPS